MVKIRAEWDVRACLNSLSMLNRYDLAYGFALAAAAPGWLAMPKWRRRIFQAFEQQMGRDIPTLDGEVLPRKSDRIMIHAVSAGEMDSTPSLIAALRHGRRDLRFIVSSTSNAGYEAARKHYASASDVTLIRYPLDFTPAISRVLDRLAPTLVVLMELEVWPNFMRQCERRGIPVVLAQGRLTLGSFRNYQRFSFVTRPMFNRLAFVCAQEETYAKRFALLGVKRERIAVVGTMKFDAAYLADSTLGSIDGALELAASVGLRPGTEPIWICGSTGAGEEAIVLRCYLKLRERFGALRLVIVPRHPPRFDEVAALVRAAGLPLVRLSEAQGEGEAADGPSPVVLGDTMGALRRFYNVADVIFIGRTLVDLGPRQHGSNMIEAAALGKPIVIGPFTGNFAEPMNLFRQAQAMLEIRTEEELCESTAALLNDRQRAAAMAARAREIVRREQGATQRHAKIILETLGGMHRDAKENAI